MKTLFSFLFIFSFSLLCAEVIETPHFNEVKKYIKPETLVILDIDDTLLLPTQTLGTDAWFLYRIEQHKKEGMKHKDAFEKALAEWQAIRHITKIKIVEEGTDQLINEMQEGKVVVMGLTTQGLALATRTIQQLASLNIDLSKTAPCQEEHYFINKLGVLYRQGILFTAGTPKGEALVKLFSKIDFHPKQIVFVNDKETHLRDVEEVAKREGIEFIGLRYSYCDARIAAFDPQIAEMQWKQSTLCHILSDEEAKALLSR
jgi:hypothetical protein